MLDEARAVLREMGKWLRVNGEAIYGTTPWMTFGEGPTKVEPGLFKENSRLEYTARDIRFTCKGDSPYAILFGWPDGKAVIETCKCLYPEEIREVTMLGHGGPLQWKLVACSLEVEVPKKKPCESAYVIKIERKRPY